MRSNVEGFTRYGDDLIQIRVPVPLALKSVNSYLLRDDDGYTWIDPGLNTKDIQDFWKNIFLQLSISPKQIKKIICTHQHPDHFGLAGYAQKLTDAPVYLSQAAYSYAQLLWGDGGDYAHKLDVLFQKHHVPKALIAEIVENLSWFNTVVLPFPSITELKPNMLFTINNEQWRTIETSGHAKGHMMLYNERKSQLICGDQVLPHITPHVGIVPSEEHEQPLQRFLDSLKRIKTLEVKESYGGHGERFTNWANRIEDIIGHHERRLSKLEQLIKEHGQLNAFEASNLIFGKHLHKQPQNLRFAITEMIAHLDYLVGINKCERLISMNQSIVYV